MEIYKLPDKELKIIGLRKFSKLWEHRQLKEIRKTIHEQKERFYREIEIIEKVDILELKNIMNEI